MLSETVILALIVAVPASLSPLVLRWWDSKSIADAKEKEAEERRTDKEQDWARQDAVADKLIASNAKVAASAKASSDIIAASAALTEEKLAELKVGQDQVHTLVNSNLTAAMEAQLEALEGKLIVQVQMHEYKKEAGKKLEPEAIASMEETTRKIADLKKSLEERAIQTKIADKKVEEAGGKGDNGKLTIVADSATIKGE